MSVEVVLSDPITSSKFTPKYGEDKKSCGKEHVEKEMTVRRSRTPKCHEKCILKVKILVKQGTASKAMCTLG